MSREDVLLKRPFDIIFSLFVLFFSVPIFIIVSFLIKLDSPGPVFFKQKRVGKNKKMFLILKFRTMKNIKGPILTVSGDVRITKIGKILRRANLDELPQFINILKGELSVVGPRPEIPEIVKMYSQDQEKIFFFNPGFTSFSTIRCLEEERYLKENNLIENYLENHLKEKIEWDIDYFTNHSNIFNDAVIILKTIGKTFNS